MNRLSLAGGRAAVALAVLALATGPLRAQDYAYPYRASAPSSYRGAGYAEQRILAGSGTYSGSVFSLPGVGAGYPGLLGSGGYGLSGAGYGLPGMAGSGGFSTSSLLAGALSLPGGNYTPPRDNAAHLWLEVPDDARVWFDGDPTKQTGTFRHFVSPPLTPGRNYLYEVRVRWTRDGKPVEVTRRVPVHANQRVRLDLSRPEARR